MAISPTSPLKDVKITNVGNLAQTEIDLSQQDQKYLFTRVWQIQVQGTFCKVPTTKSPSSLIPQSPNCSIPKSFNPRGNLLQYVLSHLLDIFIENGYWNYNVT